MATPRFQCLNAARQLVKSRKGLKAPFSTSQVARADEPSKLSATDELLRATGESPYRQSRPNSARDFIAALKTSRQPPTQSYNFSRNNSPNLTSNPIQPRPGTPRASMGGIQSILDRVEANKARQAELARQSPTISTLEEYNRSTLASDLYKRIWRRWKAGDTYAPHDLSSAEQQKWSKRKQPFYDAFDLLAMNPLDHYKNFSMISEFMSPMGRIKHRNQTGLRGVNQRKIAKAIRRTIGMGMMPSVHRHPELLYASRKNYEGIYMPTKAPPKGSTMTSPF